MGNYKFKLSELIPNAWLYKLRDMGKKNNNKKSKKQENGTVSPSPIKKPQEVLTPATTTARSPRPLLPPPRRSSHYNSRPSKTAPSCSSPSDTPRKSQLRRRQRATTTTKTNVETKSSVLKHVTQLVDFSTTSGDSTATGTGSLSPEFRSDQVLIPDESFPSSWQSPSSCVTSKMSKPELELRPIVTKPTTTVRKITTANSPATGVRLKLRSPRVSTTTRKSVSKRNVTSSSTVASSRRSRAVVKASVNPRRDFKESMEEMIMENNIRSSKELEELLACYLCLNSQEYHQVIINVFKQIWIDLNLPIHISK